MIKKVCRDCGSDEVAIDAWASWDLAGQSWVLEDVFEAGFCRKCDGEATIIDEEVPTQ